MRIFSVILPVRVSGLLFSELFLTAASYFAALAIYFQFDTIRYLTGDEHGWVRLALVSASVLIGMFVNNFYAKLRFDSRVSLLLTLCNVFGIALVVQGLLSYLVADLTLPRLVMISGSALAFVVLALWRLFYGSVILNIIGLRKIIFVGRDNVLEEIAGRVRSHPEQGYAISGYVGEDCEGDLLGGYLGRLEDIEQIAAREKANRVVVGALERGESLPVAALLRLNRRGVVIEEAQVAYESFCGRVCSHELRPSQLIFQDEMASRPGSLALQSIYTNLLALVLIIVTSPVLFLAAIAVKLSSRGPLLEPDLRIGLHGIPFSLHKFRCHRLGPAESRAAQMTAVGRWLTNLHLANLPRLFNLLRGEITLVGPKPERPEFATELSRFFPYYRQRHSVKPGMTGWGQINTSHKGREVDSLVELEYDLYYTKHISLALDAYIILHGIRTMLPFARL